MKSPSTENTGLASSGKTPVSLQTEVSLGESPSITAERKKTKEDGGGIKNPDPKPDDNTTIKNIPTDKSTPDGPVDLKKILLEKAEEDKKRGDKLGSIVGTTTDSSGGPNRSDPPIEKPGKPQ